MNGCNGAPIGIATDVSSSRPIGCATRRQNPAWFFFTDNFQIGGSIRAPAAFNGLYGIRPTSRRFSYKGNSLEYTGQGSILSTIGPVGRSLRDIELMCKILNAAEPWLYDPAVMAKKWEPVEVPKKATIGVMYWDEVVMPHPPIQRALKTTVEKLKAAGHEGTLFLLHLLPPALTSYSDRVQTIQAEVRMGPSSECSPFGLVCSCVANPPSSSNCTIKREPSTTLTPWLRLARWRFQPEPNFSRRYVRSRTSTS